MVYICLNTMNGLRKISLKIFFSRALLILNVFIVTCPARAQHTPISNFDSALTKKVDTLKPRPAPRTTQPVAITSSDTIPVNDSTAMQKVDTFSLRLSKDTLDAPINYFAEDSVVVM